MKRISLLLMVVVSIFMACSDETTVFTDPNDDIQLEASEDGLQSSIVYDNAGVLDIDDFSETSSVTGKNPPEDAGDYPLTLIAQVRPPSFSGATNLTASHVHLNGDFAFVSYNTVGEEWIGALDAINISDPNRPFVTSRIFYTNADISSLTYDDGFVYLVGGFDSERSATIDFNSFISKIEFTNGRFNLRNLNYAFQVGFVGTDVEVDANTVYVTSGKDGAVNSYNKADLNVINESPFSDIRSVSVKDQTVAILDASSGVQLLDQNLALIKEIAISSDFGDLTKKTLEFKNDKLFVPEAGQGAGVYNATTGDLIEYIPILVNPEGVAAGDIVTNAIASNEEMILLANGGAGLCLSEDNGNGTTDLVGVVELEGSINYVESKGDYIFAASGTEGLQIIKLNRPSQSLEAICADLPAYSGSANLNINANETVGYRGSKRFSGINVGGNLTLCGSWTVQNDVNISNNALFEMNGTLAVGNNNSNSTRNVVVNSGATLRIEGNLIIYGNLILNDGATLEFIGDSNVANIFGNVVMNNNVTISGTFDDVNNKF